MLAIVLKKFSVQPHLPHRIENGDAMTSIQQRAELQRRILVEIAPLNAALKTTVARIDQLRKEIDAIVAEIEGERA